MTYADSGEPDITLVLDSTGVINEAIAGGLVADEPIADWIGLPWSETVRRDERADIGRLVQRTRMGGLAGVGQVAQRFPSGLEVSLEYTLVRLGDSGHIVAVGKQPKAVAELQSQLRDAQRGLEQDYWKLRAVETRYRLLQSAAEGTCSLSAAGAGTRDHADLIERSPDGFVVIDPEGLVLSANAAFVELTQEGAEPALLGHSLNNWLGRPGADLTVLLASVRRFGRLRHFATLIRGGLGSETEAELSAAGDADVGPRRIAVLVRDVGRRLAREPSDVSLRTLVDAYAERVGKAPLRTIVDETVALVEHHFVKAALQLTAGNRTAAAKLLGLSRQSLHAKLHRYGLERMITSDSVTQSAADWPL